MKWGEVKVLLKIKIRNYSLPKSPRIFDVTVNEEGKIQRYDVQNIKGCIYIDDTEVKRQIKEALENKVG